MDELKNFVLDFSLKMSHAHGFITFITENDYDSDSLLMDLGLGKGKTGFNGNIDAVLCGKTVMDLIQKFVNAQQSMLLLIFFLVSNSLSSLLFDIFIKLNRVHSALDIAGTIGIITKPCMNLIKTIIET